MDLNRRGLIGIEAMVMAGLVAIGLATWHGGEVYNHFFPPTVYLSDTKAIGVLKAYGGAQAIYRRRKGVYADRIGKLSANKKQRLRLLDRPIARASGPTGKPYAGWLFHTPRRAEGDYKWTFEYCLAAQPAEYDKTEGSTYYTDQSANIWRKDLNGRRLFRLPADPAAEGWVKTGG